MSLLTAPFYALFSIEFYKRILKTPLSQGFIYLAYLALISSVAFHVYLNVRLMPQVNEIMTWAQAEMPALVWTPEGMQMQTQEETYTMVHPEWGEVVHFHMERTQVDLNDFENNIVLVTQKKVFFRHLGQVHSYDLTAPLNAQYQGPSQVPINAQVFERFRNNIEPWKKGLAALFAFPFFYLGKLCFGLFMSLLASIFNQRRSEPALFGAILNVTFFALTADTILKSMGMIVPQIHILTLGFLGSVLVTGCYLFVGIKKTEVSI